ESLRRAAGGGGDPASARNAGRRASGPHSTHANDGKGSQRFPVGGESAFGPDRHPDRAAGTSGKRRGIGRERDGRRAGGSAAVGVGRQWARPQEEKPGAAGRRKKLRRSKAAARQWNKPSRAAGILRSGTASISPHSAAGRWP